MSVVRIYIYKSKEYIESKERKRNFMSKYRLKKDSITH